MAAGLEQRGSVPVPDPTKLTTDAVALAKAEMERLFDTKLDGLRELINEKFLGRDTALAAALKAANERVEQQNTSNQRAADKSEAAFSTQIAGLEGKIGDIKDRVSELATRNWAVVGAYLVGALGIAGLIGASIIIHH